MITLKTLPQATAQEVFNQVAEHLLTQNAVSFRDHGSIGCAYKNGQGLSCAAGCLIAPEEYKPEFEGKSWTELGRRFAEVSSRHAMLIHQLQLVHDNGSVTKWPLKLLELAQNFGLDPNQVPLLAGRISQLS